MVIHSRNPRRFLQRFGLIPTERQTRPRLALSRSRAHSLPLEAIELDPSQVLDQSGPPSPGGGITRPWPPQQQVIPDA